MNRLSVKMLIGALSFSLCAESVDAQSVKAYETAAVAAAKKRNEQLKKRRAELEIEARQRAQMELKENEKRKLKQDNNNRLARSLFISNFTQKIENCGADAYLLNGGGQLAQVKSLDQNISAFNAFLRRLHYQIEYHQVTQLEKLNNDSAINYKTFSFEFSEIANDKNVLVIKYRGVSWRSFDDYFKFGVVVTDENNNVIRSEQDMKITCVDPVYIAHEAIPKGSGGYIAHEAIPKGSGGEWTSDNDYPTRALALGQEGVVHFRLTIDINGNVSNCSVEKSSGSEELDKTTCYLVSRRARFEPATDESGDFVIGHYRASVNWQISKH